MSTIADLYNAITQGTNIQLQSISDLTQQTSAQITLLTNEASGTLNKMNGLLDQISPIVDNLNGLENNVNRIVTFLLIILIVVFIIIMVLFGYWLLIHIYPLARGIVPRPKNFDDFVLALKPLGTVRDPKAEQDFALRRNDDSQLYTAQQHTMSKEAFSASLNPQNIPAVIPGKKHRL